MADDEQIAALSRQAFGVAGQIQMLAENMAALSRQPDGYTPHDLTELANTLRGFALRTAMSIGDTALMTELSGRQFRRLDRDDLPE